MNTPYSKGLSSNKCATTVDVIDAWKEECDFNENVECLN